MKHKREILKNINKAILTEISKRSVETRTPFMERIQKFIKEKEISNT